MSNRIDKNSDKKKAKLKLIGFIVLIIGIVLFITAIFGFGSMNTDLFFLAFLGLPMIAFGSSMLMMAYQGAINRFNASQNAPVLKDTINYLKDETKINLGSNGKQCKSCGNLNDKDAIFCDKCGSSLVKICDSCSCENDGDAVFCKSCGKKF